MSNYISKLESDDTDEFFKAVLSLKDIEECYRFFEDICTVKEIKSISQRLQVAKLLTLKKTYNDIEDETGASTATISRVNRVLNYGEGGYDLTLEKLGYEREKEEEREEKSKKERKERKDKREKHKKEK